MEKYILPEPFPVHFRGRKKFILCPIKTLIPSNLTSAQGEVNNLYNDKGGRQ